MAAAAGVYVLVDEVYLDAAQRVLDLPPTGSSAAQIDGPFIVTNSLTKSYGLAGLRSGWIIAPVELAERLRRTRDVIDNANPAPSDLLARTAFAFLPQIGDRARGILSANLEAARQLFTNRPDFELCEPPRTSVVFPRLHGVADATPFVRALADRDIAVAPGTFFDSPAHFRIGLGGRPDLVRRSLEKLADSPRHRAIG
jgi:aspartate/methionine/tyrosine aminotransferase